MGIIVTSNVCYISPSFADAGGQVVKDKARKQSLNHNNRQSFLMNIQGKKEYQATTTHGTTCIIQDPESDISIKVAKGPNTLLMQHIHTNMETVGHATSNNECIVSPTVRIHTTEIASQSEVHIQEHTDEQREVEASSLSSQDRHVHQNNTQGEQIDFQEAHSSQMWPFIPVDTDQEETKYRHRFKLTIPHYVEQEELLPTIQVKWGNIHSELFEVRKGESKDKYEPYCEVYRDHVILYASHFCDVVCTSTAKVCASKLLAFPFGQIDSEPARKETHTKVKTYLCNHLYQDKSLKMVAFYFYFHQNKSE